jgi:hypothetical protein
MGFAAFGAGFGRYERWYGRYPGDRRFVPDWSATAALRQVVSGFRYRMSRID